MRIFFSIIICSSLLAGCNYTIAKHADLGNGNSQSKTLPQSAPIDWTLMQNAVLLTCADCHSGKHKPSLASYADVVNHITKVWGEVSSDSMPPPKAGYAPLSPCYKAALKKWMDMSQPQTSSVTVASLPECAGDTPPPPTVPIGQLPLNYSNLVKYILQPKCMCCHNPGADSDAAGVLFDPYDVIAKDQRWAPPAKDSKVISVLTRTDKDRMPPPEEGPALSAEEIDYIARWIDAGRPQ